MRRYRAFVCESYFLSPFPEPAAGISAPSTYPRGGPLKRKNKSTDKSKFVNEAAGTKYDTKKLRPYGAGFSRLCLLYVQRLHEGNAFLSPSMTRCHIWRGVYVRS